MAKQTFTTGQVLTAAQMTSLQQTAMGGGSTTAKVASYTLVAADAGTVVQMNSASATTITVNTALFAAGDTVQIQNVGAGVCTVTAGTATVSTSATLALKQYDAGTLYFNSTSAAIFFAVDAADGMANVLTTTGDIIYSSSGTTAARLGIGSASQVLSVSSGIPAWTTPASGALTLITRQSFSNVANTGTTFDSIFSSTYKTYEVIIEQSSAVTYSDDLQVQFRYAGPTTQTTSYYASRIQTDYSVSTVTNYGTNNGSVISLSDRQGSSPNGTSAQFYVYRVGNSSEIPYITGTSFNQDAMEFCSFAGNTQTSRIYTGLLFKSASTNISGTIAVYGLATA